MNNPLLTAIKSSAGSKRIEDVFCIFDSDEKAAKAAHRLHGDGILRLVRSKKLQVKQNSYSYKLYRFAKEDSKS